MGMDEVPSTHKTRWTGWFLIVVGIALAAGFVAVATVIAREAVGASPVRIAAIPVLLSASLIAIGVALVRRAREGDL